MYVQPASTSTYLASLYHTLRNSFAVSVVDWLVEKKIETIFNYFWIQHQGTKIVALSSEVFNLNFSVNYSSSTQNRSQWQKI